MKMVQTETKIISSVCPCFAAGVKNKACNHGMERARLQLNGPEYLMNMKPLMLKFRLF